MFGKAKKIDRKKESGNNIKMELKGIMEWKSEKKEY
jgi:hypothetical protein